MIREELVERLRAIVLRELPASMMSWARRDTAERIAEAVALEAIPVEPTEAEGALDWLAENVGMELSWGEVGNDPSDCAWRVHRRHGGVNDREWTLVAVADSPLEALAASRDTDSIGG
jgi:hypothetical protein